MSAPKLFRRFPRLVAFVRGWIPFIGGPWDGKRERVSRIEVLLGLTLPKWPALIARENGRLDSKPIGDTFSDADLDGWIGNYECHCGGLAMQWKPYESPESDRSSRTGGQRT